MEPTFRKSMAWLHTWAGVVIGSLLFVIFWMGTLSVFDREIDRWMAPGTRLTPSLARQPVQLDGAITEQIQRLAQGSPQWFIRLPSERVPVVEAGWRNPNTKATEHRALHPQTGALLEHTDTLGGTGFIFPFHYRLHLRWQDLGYWLVGLAGMAMLLLVISGVVIHRKIFADFFLFRPGKKLQRASLDLHNITGVLAMPFHFMVALSGLVILFSTYFPSAIVGAYGQGPAATKEARQEMFGQYQRVKANQPGQLASLDAMVRQAEQAWGGGKANNVRVWHPGDKNSYVEVRRSYADMVTMNLDLAYFDAGSGAELQRFTAAPVVRVERFISGMHFAQWDHWTLRGLYFLAGLSGCVLIATGFLFWLEARRARHAKNGLAGVRVVEALLVFSVPGTIAATLVFFSFNRLLPVNAALAGYDRSDLEVWAFYLFWLATLAHAALRRRRAWHEQTWAVAALAVSAVVLNWLTTGQHLGYTLSHGLWAVAGMDLLLLSGAAVAALSARHLTCKAGAFQTGPGHDPQFPAPAQLGSEASHA